MAYRVIWSPRAVADLDSIAIFLASDSPAYASAVVRRIVQATRSLCKSPDIGRRVPEFEDKNLREIFAYSFRIIYRIEEDEITIATIIHGRRSLLV